MRIDSDFKMTINGESVDSDLELGIINPATGKVFTNAPLCTKEQLDTAVASARTAFSTWKNVPIEERQALIKKAGDALIENVEELSILFSKEQGRPIAGAQFEISGAGQWMQAMSAMAPPVHTIEDSESQKIETHFVPLGVVCGIAPWNFPVSLAIWKIAPALLAGNTMVLKPSPFTPLCTLKIGEIFQDIFPPGVLNIVSGDDDLGPMMTAHPGFNKISFTGSTPTGKRVMASAAQDLKRVTLELGGNDAAIILPDVDVNEIAEQVFMGAFFNTGQICIATKRLYVHEDIYDKLRDRLFMLAENSPLGDGSDEGTALGPLQNKRQFDHVMSLLDDAKSNNYTLLQGPAGPDSGGYFVPLTIVDNPPESSRAVQEEAFGPILPMMKFTDVNEVIGRVNDSEYGLGASIWSKDLEGAKAIALQIEAGTVWINQNLSLRPDTAFAGHKQSGMGVENGMEGLLEFTQPQSIHVSMPKS